VLNVDPGDMGFGLVARPRAYTVCIHRAKCEQHNDPTKVYSLLKAALHSRDAADAPGAPGAPGTPAVPLEAAFQETNLEEMVREMRLMGGARAKKLDGFDYALNVHDWRPLLTPWEKANIRKYEKLWEEKYETDPNKDMAAVFVLMQNADSFKSMTGADARGRPGRPHAKGSVAHMPRGVFLMNCLLMQRNLLGPNCSELWASRPSSDFDEDWHPKDVELCKIALAHAQGEVSNHGVSGVPGHGLQNAYSSTACTALLCAGRCA
jgi:hypothetical protein